MTKQAVYVMCCTVYVEARLRKHFFFRGKGIKITHSECVFAALDRFALGSSPYGPDAPRPFRRALCVP
jgi:hypothetical protein